MHLANRKEERMKNELIKVTQLPIIDYSMMDAEIERVKNQLAKYTSGKLVVTEENKSEMKKLRANLRKEWLELEEMKKVIKNAVTQPYQEFEEKYNQGFKKLYQEADNQLKNSIDEVDNAIKEAIEDEVMEYFETNNNHDWLTYEDLGMKINLSSSMKSYKDYIDTYLDQVKKDLALIETQPNKERILVRYYQSKDASLSITRVNDEIQREQALTQKVEPITEEKLERQAEVTRESKGLSKPVEVADEQVFELAFKVRGTKAKLKALRDYLDFGGYDYE